MCNLEQKDDWYSEMWNAQCWNDGATEGAADISVFIGEYGWNQYKSLHQETVNAWREWTEFKCDVDSGPW
jgi:hypothetical protein